MQLFPCPFCGLRDETEFHYSGEAGNPRPEGPDVSAEAWANYLWLRANPKGESREIWLHLTCGEFFAMTRDTVSHAVAGSSALTSGGGDS